MIYDRKNYEKDNYCIVIVIVNTTIYLAPSVASYF